MTPSASQLELGVELELAARNRERDQYLHDVKQIQRGLVEPQLVGGFNSFEKC